MADYTNKANDFEARMREGVNSKASEKGLAEWKAKQKKSSGSNANSDTVKNAREKARGGQTR